MIEHFTNKMERQTSESGVLSSTMAAANADHAWSVRNGGSFPRIKWTAGNGSEIRMTPLTDLRLNDSLGLELSLAVSRDTIATCHQGLHLIGRRTREQHSW